ncbi:uncharacterized protein LOC117332399 [Pecten maximus]|uniref:uncharacterized protein LOC117332399 n=1 Tax=Pecten maximus TaxID=6579 RepID=UPI001457E5BA|nr:uncharacterized protein LOC117332399 [Pecten maximus]
MQITMMNSTESERMSVLLSTLLERTVTGTDEMVNIKRKAVVLDERFQTSDIVDIFLTGSNGEGVSLSGSDVDGMTVYKWAEVVYPDQRFSQHLTHKSIIYIREAECRPGYVKLEIGQLKFPFQQLFDSTLVRIGNSKFISSDIFREKMVSPLSKHTGVQFESNGPSISYRGNRGIGDCDLVACFPCNSWPREANEWITRTRLYGWPHQTLIDKIVNKGFHLVPVGDKCSKDTFLQWRISLVVAERSLVHSFSLLQVKVYVLLKHFLKQIKETLKETIGDDDILCSYFLKTILFHAIENSSQRFWQDKNLFYCFWFCINILLGWVRAGFCPNYFIPTNNMFQRKVHGQHQQILLDILYNYSEMKWMCLSVGNQKPSIWESLCDTSIQSLLVVPWTVEFKMLHTDREIFTAISTRLYPMEENSSNAFHLLSTSKSEFEEVYTYHNAMSSLRRLSSELISEELYENRAAPGNKTRYRRLRKCKYWISPGALMGTDVLHLATFHFLTGNFTKCLGISRRVMKLATFFRENVKQDRDFWKLHWQPHGCTLERLQKIYTDFITFHTNGIYLPHLCLEVSTDIPPLPYVLFLNFLCCHELGDTRGRDEALHQLIQIQYHKEQGGHKFWIVHTLLGICYQILGDYQRAIRAYLESSQSRLLFLPFNPAIDRIAIVYLCMYVSQRSDRG